VNETGTTANIKITQFLTLIPTHYLGVTRGIEKGLESSTRIRGENGKYHPSNVSRRESIFGMIESARGTEIEIETGRGKKMIWTSYVPLLLPGNIHLSLTYRLILTHSTLTVKAKHRPPQSLLLGIGIVIATVIETVDHPYHYQCLLPAPRPVLQWPQSPGALHPPYLTTFHQGGESQ
jgi:hypothetical protein